MKYFLVSILLTLITSDLFAQQQRYDIAKYTPPKGWKKESTKSLVSYSTTNASTRSWCRISLVKSMPSTGQLDTDFAAEWKDIVTSAYTITDTIATYSINAEEGWALKAGSSTFQFEKKPAIVMLTTFSDGIKRMSLLLSSNDIAAYLSFYQDMIGSIHPDKSKPGTSTTVAATPTQVSPPSNYTMTITNWDDGWVTTEKADWAEVTKSTIKVLIHYPNKIADTYYSVLKDGDLNAWNTLVAPHYRSITNLQWRSIQSFESITYLSADATEIASGKKVFVVLFKQHYNKGNGRYLEFVAPEKTWIEQQFGAYHNTEFDWNTYANMQSRNKFAVTAKDLVGSWSANDYASLQYYYVGTGGFAGATATSTADEFNFLTSTKYTSDHAGASGQVGNQKFSRQVYNGNYTVNNWSMNLTNRFGGATETYQCSFEAVKGGRILVLTDRLNSVLTLGRKILARGQ